MGAESSEGTFAGFLDLDGFTARLSGFLGRDMGHFMSKSHTELNVIYTSVELGGSLSLSRKASIAARTISSGLQPLAMAVASRRAKSSGGMRISVSSFTARFFHADPDAECPTPSKIADPVQ